VARRAPRGQGGLKIAKALGVTMSDLMGRKLLPAVTQHVPDSLPDFADEEELPEAHPYMLVPSSTAASTRLQQGGLRVASSLVRESGQPILSANR
jgi:hypothetical protein